MKRKSQILLPLLALGIILAGCVSPGTRRTDYLEEHPGLNPEMKKAISGGKLARGMTMAEVRASWGEPDMVTTTVSEEGTDRVWSYDSYHEDQENDVPVIGRFEKGKVTGWVQ